MPAAQQCWYCHTHDTAGSIQSVENQVVQVEGTAKQELRYGITIVKSVLTTLFCETILKEYDQGANFGYS